MSGNGKIMCNHGYHLFKCQTCIDALVAEQIEKQEQRITELEQQLKAAKVSAISEAIRNAEVIKWATDAANGYEGESFDAWKVGFQDCRLSLIEYANNLEDK